VTGLRGVGKTQLAAAYARDRVRAGWGLVAWVNAETPDVLLAGLAQVAARLGVADPRGDSLESARRLREHLQTRAGNGLLVFDNAADPGGGCARSPSLTCSAQSPAGTTPRQPPPRCCCQCRLPRPPMPPD
jgi:hypothetical protein